VAEGAFRERFPDSLLERAGLLPPGHRERALEFGFGLARGSAADRQERRAQPPDLGLPQLGTAAHAERLTSQRESGLRPASQRIALEQQAGGEAGYTWRGRRTADELSAYRTDPRESGVRSAVKDVQVAGEHLGHQPDLSGTFVLHSGERPGVTAELQGIAAVHGENGRPHQGDRAAVGVGGLAGDSQGTVTLAIGPFRVTEQPEGVGQAQPDEQFGILPVAQHVLGLATQLPGELEGTRVHPPYLLRCVALAGQ
jgi:hypothetical protein